MKHDEISLRGMDLSGHISLASTTYGTDSYYTHSCLESIRSWKNQQHELVVACHDPSLLLEFYLKACLQDGLIDKLIWTPSGCGHTRGVNRCFEEARGEFFFNIANDILIGPALVNDCARKLCNPQLGLIGWHWYNEGTFWQEERIREYRVREEAAPQLSPADEANIRQASWFTGRFFEAAGPLWLCLCNTAFFGIRRELWQKVGGFNGPYEHYWADDFLNYAVLDQGLDISHFEAKFRCREYFHEFQYDNMGSEDRFRHDDRIPLPPALQDYIDTLEGGLSGEEPQLLYQIARSLPSQQTVLHVGLWRGAGLCVFMEAMRGKEAHFIGIDGFDEEGISQMSAQPPVSREECLRYLEPFLTEKHQLTLIKGNTLTMEAFPAADVIFVDAGHTRPCIENDLRLAHAALKPQGFLIFHDYGQPSWPDIQAVLDEHFKPEQIRTFGTLAMVQP